MESSDGNLEKSKDAPTRRPIVNFEESNEDIVKDSVEDSTIRKI